MTEETTITAYKGFDKNLKCRDFQYEVGKTYKHKGEVSACNSGFHACENPLNVFDYYPPTSRFAIVKCAGKISKESNGDTKIACGKLTVEAEIGLSKLIDDAVQWIHSIIDLENKKISDTGYRSAASSTGDYSAASSTGNYSVASSTGNQSAASSTGDRSAASSTGDWSAAEVSGLHSIACALGMESKAKSAAGGAIVCVYRNDDGDLTHIRAAKVGDAGIKADTWYMLDDTGEFVECE